MRGFVRREPCLLLLSLVVALSSNSSPAADRFPTPNVDPQLGFLGVFHVIRAASRFARPECAAVLNDFVDVESGLPLSHRLEVLEMTPASYLSRLYYRKAPANSPCKRAGVMAFTSPGSFVIWVCPAPFLETARRDEVLAASILIHETLHSLGLGENPPTSAEITARVRERCGW